MLKRILISTGLSIVALSMSALPLTPAEALTRVCRDGKLSAKARNMSADRLVYTAKTAEGENALYVFDNGKGFMLLSADDAAAPLLGYSDSSSFDVDNLPSELRWWIEMYVEQIGASAGSGIVYTKSGMRDADKDAIAPMIKTKWDQEAPYNKDCPVINGRTSVTGCVATSMAQLMNYHKYPEVGEGVIRYSTNTYKKNLILNLGLKSFNWSDMLDVYNQGHYTDEQADAVAYLMKCCGYSVEMDYSPEESGAVSSTIAGALVNYFKYDKGTYYANRNMYSTAEWNNMIYDNLKNVGPVIYNGASSISGGHSFICDGYDGNGYYHFNWGWSGMSDGYFLLDALNPESLGVGGGSGGFNFRQGAILGAQPPKEDTVEKMQTLTQTGTLNASISGGNISFSLSGASPAYWMNPGPKDLTFKFGAIFEPVDGTVGESFTTPCTLNGITQVTSLRANYYFNNITPSCSLTGMNDGKYKVTIAIQDQSGNDLPWVPVQCDYRFNNFVYVIKSGTTYTIENPAMKILKVSEVKLGSDLILECLAKISVTIVNDTDYELTQGFAPILSYEGTAFYVGESILATLAPNTTETRDIYTSFYGIGSGSSPASSTMTLQVYNPADGISAIYEGADETVTIVRSPGTPMISLIDTEVKAEVGEDGVYVVDAGIPVEFTSTVKLLRGYFAYPLYVGIYDESGELVMEKRIEDNVLFMNAGETESITTDVLYTLAEEGMTYICKLGYYRQYSFVGIGNGFKFRVKAGSGIDEIANSETTSVNIIFDRTTDTVTAMSGQDVAGITVYDISGKIITSTSEDFLDLSGSARGVLLVCVQSADGSTTVKKIVR